MPLKLWIGDGLHAFVDTFLGCECQVGQTYKESDGSWTVDVNGEYVKGLPSLNAAKRLFVEKYDRSWVQLSPGSLGDSDEYRDNYKIIDLTPLQKSVGRARRPAKRQRKHRR
jgi:hypothetical protein